MDDDDVQFLYQKSPDPIACQICSVPLNNKTLTERHAHYDRHFSGEAEGSPNATTHPENFCERGGAPSESKTIDKAPLDKENIFWYPSQHVAPPLNFTPGLIPILKRAIIKTHAKGNTQRAVLCYEGMVHIATESWDMGWGCGYRNFLMACTALIDQPVQPLYFPLLDSPMPPGVRNLQHWIETAWQHGFDEEGASQLKHKLVGTNKWIGTAELYVAFVSRGIPVRLVDFLNVKSGVQPVLDWVVNYFSPMHDSKKKTITEALRGASPVITTDRMPLILQHAGHSRTVVGYEIQKNGSVNLLLFDPSKRPKNVMRNAALACVSSPRDTSSHEHVLSPSRIFDRVLHPRSHGAEQKKRRASSSLHKNEDVKRVRGGLKDEGINEVFIDENEPGERTREQENEDKLDPFRVVNFFRLNPSKLGKNDRYQILYFPLGEALNEQERWTKRIVTSERVG